MSRAVEWATPELELATAALIASIPGTKAILHHPLLTRLRHVRQTGFVVLLDRRASHSRFEHSVGCAYLALQAISALRDSCPSLNLNESVVRVVVIAALLHDVGHGPYSHVFDKFVSSIGTSRLGPLADETHERRGARLIDLAFRRPALTLSHEDWTAVMAIICPESVPWPPHIPQSLRTIVNTPSPLHLDVDRLDYLQRDARHLAAMHPPIGREDATRVNPISMCKSGRLINGLWTLETKATEAWLNQRKWFHTTVARHPIVTAAEKRYEEVLGRRLSVAALRRVLTSLDEWYTFTDRTVNIVAESSRFRNYSIPSLSD